MGRRLARTFGELGLEADVVIPVPDSACTAALSMAQRTGPALPRGPGQEPLRRTHVHHAQRRRAAQLGAQQAEHDRRGVPRQATCLLVDDSIVRGNTSRQIVQLARAAGAAQGLLRLDLAAAGPSLCLRHRHEHASRVRRPRPHAGQIAEQIGADAVIYQRLDDLVASVREDRPDIEHMCTACFSGEYPTGDITPEMLLQIEEERTLQGK